MIYDKLRNDDKYIKFIDCMAVLHLLLQFSAILLCQIRLRGLKALDYDFF